MAAKLKLSFSNGGELIIETDEDKEPNKFENGVTKTSSKGKIKEKLVKVIEVAPIAFDKITNSIVGLSYEIFKKFESSNYKNKPKNITIEYGINLSAGADVKLAKTSAEGSIKIITQW
jgi:hypothetical protein